MSWYPSDRWRDSYDAWKLATPPEYDTEEMESDEEHLAQEEFEMWCLQEIEIQSMERIV